MDKPFNFEDILDRWKRDYGTPRNGKKYGNEYDSIPIRERRELYKILVREIKEAGKDKDYFTNTKREEIITHSIPSAKAVRGTHAEWKMCARNDLRAAIVAVFDEDRSERQKADEPEVEGMAKDQSFTEEFVSSMTEEEKAAMEPELDADLAELFGKNK